jgi:hypothetical protein
MRIRSLLPFTAIALLVLTACPGAKSIQSLLDDPGQYDGKTVRIAGEVTQSIGALGIGGYQVNDGTGTLLVVTKTLGSTPRVGARVGVEGTFRSAYTVGSHSGAVLIESKRKTE